MNLDQGRPPWVPWLWLRGSGGRRAWQEPETVLRRLILAPIVLIIAAVLSLAGATTVVGVVLACLAVVQLAVTAVYGPRAMRAARRRR